MWSLMSVLNILFCPLQCTVTLWKKSPLFKTAACDCLMLMNMSVHLYFTQHLHGQYTLMVKKYNIYPERADEPYTALTDMSVHHVMTSTAVKNMLSSLLTIYITARHISKLPHLVKVKLYRHTCWEESEHEQLHWWRCLEPWLTAQGQGFASQQRWALKALGQHCLSAWSPVFVVCIYCPGYSSFFFSYCVFTFLT